jgi:hypothetical protein
MEEWRYGLWTIRNAIGWGWLTLAWMRRREYIRACSAGGPVDAAG